MGLFDFFSRRAAAVRRSPGRVHAAGDGGVTISTPGQLDAYLRGDGSEAGLAVAPQTAMRVAAVFACVRVISTAVGTMPLGVRRRVDARTREDASDHPLWRVLVRRPNGWMKSAQFRRVLTTHLLLRGNAYALIIRDGRGDVAELWPLHPDRVRKEQADDMSVSYVYTRKDGRRTVLGAGEVMHLMGLSLDGLTGVSVVAYARRAIGLSLSAEQHGATVFENGTALGALLKHPHSLGQEGQEALRASLDAYRGSANAGKTLILEEGMEYETIGMTMEDAQYIETRKFTRGEIAMFFGVPPHMIGDTEKSTSWGTGIEEQSRGFVTYTLEPYLIEWEQGVDADLLDPVRDGDVFARFNRAALVRGNLAARWAAYVQGLQWGVYSPNEVRAAEDEPPREGGDTYYQPPNTAGTPGTPGTNEDKSNDPAQAAADQ